ncbi:hypothetical protein RvY_02384-1 [Ramazzottius varieornatus]|uniref:Uncharacterized protein n=1 Tax=Ramazzottius varieornatus TaxID=947166 RepID=A0A1D1UNA3_RAMVA|nr:hypothetical protein RvY_02384-1 [Ramazzottius varieornatus]
MLPRRRAMEKSLPKASVLPLWSGNTPLCRPDALISALLGRLNITVEDLVAPPWPFALHPEGEAAYLAEEALGDAGNEQNEGGVETEDVAADPRAAAQQRRPPAVQPTLVADADGTLQLAIPEDSLEDQRNRGEPAGN